MWCCVVFCALRDACGWCAASVRARGVLRGVLRVVLRVVLRGVMHVYNIFE